VTEAVGDMKGWKAMVKAMMQEREEMRWRQEMVEKSTLERYMRVKGSLKAEWFLGEARVWVRRWVRLRASATCLEVSDGRRRGVFRDKRVCGWCDGGKVEDEEHFLEGCPSQRWARHRKGVWDEMREGDSQAVKRIEMGGREERVDWMLAGGCSVRTRGTLLKRVGAWVAEREKVGRGRVGSERWGESMSMKERARMAGVVAGRVARSIPRVVAAAARGAWAAALAAGPGVVASAAPSSAS
jgi:hypothetical protein